MSEKFEFCEVVKVSPSETARKFVIDGMEGVVLGISEGQDSNYYAILVGDQTYSLGEDDLESTGHFVPRDQIYDGDLLIVNQAGKAIRYTTINDGVVENNFRHPHDS